MQVSLYVHAWQALLMFLAGVVSVLASLGGYLRAGGGEELLQQALREFLPTGGHAKFERLDFDLKRSTLTVYKLYHTPFVDGPDRLSGLEAERAEVRLDLWPWPPRVESILVDGVRQLQAVVREDFLQRRDRPYPKGPPFPVYVQGVDFTAQVGNLPRLDLKGCGGALTRGPGGELIGEFSLKNLNGQPFNFTLSSLADGRWECRGDEVDINTRSLHMDRGQLGGGELDPVLLLLRTLLTGESEARGTVSFRILVRPASESGPFECEGHMAYRNLELRLPREKDPGAVVVPSFLDWMLFGQRSLWPRWLLAEALKTGPAGRISFHMRGHRLEFACDEGAGSAFLASAQGRDLPSLESLKGSVETGADHRPDRIILRGLLGNQMALELRMRRMPGGGREFDLLLEPRAGGDGPGGFFNVPLWRFRSRVEDLSALPAAGPAERALVKFDVEITAGRFPDSLLLPPGMRDLSGRLRVTGRFTSDRVLRLDDVRWREGGMAFGGADAPGPHELSNLIYGPFFERLRQLWGAGPLEWLLQDVALAGKAEVRFDETNRWLSTVLSGFTLASGRVVFGGLTTDLGAANIEIQGFYRRASNQPESAEFHFEAGPRDPKSMKYRWMMLLTGRQHENGDAEVRFEERDVPRDLHPERERIPGQFVRGLLDKTIRRTTLLRIQDGKPERLAQP